MVFSRQEYGSGLLLLSPGYLPDPGTESSSPVLEADSLPSELPEKPNVGEWKGKDGEHGRGPMGQVPREIRSDRIQNADHRSQDTFIPQTNCSRILRWY